MPCVVVGYFRSLKTGEVDALKKLASRTFNRNRSSPSFDQARGAILGDAVNIRGGARIGSPPEKLVAAVFGADVAGHTTA
jgi:hypothetical protein